MSDSVIGSAAQRLLDFADKHAVDESNFDSNDRAAMHGMVLGIQREAVEKYREALEAIIDADDSGSSVSISIAIELARGVLRDTT